MPAHVAIVGVSKFQPAAALAEAAAAGLRDVGENYVQEARRKFAIGPAGVRKHFIGHVQTNKAKAIAETFDVVQSVDRIEAALALSSAAHHAGKTLEILLQLNISPSERYGCPPELAEALAVKLRELPGLHLNGVMAIGPLTEDRDTLRQSFALAAAARERIGGAVLSLGMSADWREAVAAGSTMVRIGTAIFGPRPAVRASKE